MDIDTKRLRELESSEDTDFDDENPLADDDFNNKTFKENLENI